MKKVLSFFWVSLLTISLFGQYDPKENFYDAEFFLAEEDYQEALFSFKKVYDNGFADNANINYRIGVCLLNIDGRKTEAIPYLERAIKNINEKYKVGSFKEDGAPPDAYLYLGNAYRINYQSDKACESYSKYLEYFDDPEAHDHQVIYTKIQIAACKLTASAKDAPVEYQAGTLGQLNKISVPIYNMTVSGDLNTIAFMGQHKFYNGIYVSKKIDGKWLKPINITPSVQSDGNQDVVALSHDGNQLLLAWSDEFDSEIWISRFSDDKWSKSVPFGKPINSKYFESHAALSPDGNTIYFTSNRKESLGEMDIFKSIKNADGTWGEAVQPGDRINTHLNEDAPYVSPDGKRLYFSSQGGNSIGGFDIYYVDINDDGTYGEPVNLGYPLNTGDDDFAFTPKEVVYDDYITTYAKGDADQVDLFRFELIPEFADPVAVAFMEQPEEEEIAEEVVEEVVIPKEVKPVKAERYVIKPIFFDFDSDKLSANAMKKLDGLSAIMERFPSIELEIEGHTDAVGSNDYNKLLSQRRAKSVSEYLAGKNIAKNRLGVKGMSENAPVAINRTSDNHDAPKGRQLNRRVEFKIKVAEGILLEVAEVEVPDDLKIN